MAPLLLGVILIVIFYFIFASTGKSQKQKRTAAVVGAASSVAKNLQNPYRSTYSPPVMSDYNDYLLSTGLEQSVISSHKQFVNDIQNTTTGASAMSIYSEEPETTNWVGLRRPNYQDIYIDPNARQVPSVEQSQMPNNKQYNKCGLF